MTKKFEVSVGMSVAAIPSGNAARYSQSVVEGEITKIGRKYFYVQFQSEWKPIKFDLETFESYCEDCNSHYTLFQSVKDANEELQRKEWLRQLQNVFCLSVSTANKLPYGSIKEIYDTVQRNLESPKKRPTIESDAQAYRTIAKHCFRAYRRYESGGDQILIMANNLDDAYRAANQYFGYFDLEERTFVGVYPYKPTGIPNVFK